MYARACMHELANASGYMCACEPAVLFNRFRLPLSRVSYPPSYPHNISMKAIPAEDYGCNSLDEQAVVV